jgi:hypothetical protein
MPYGKITPLQSESNGGTQLFLRLLGATPQAYRERFSSGVAPKHLAQLQR